MEGSEERRHAARGSAAGTAALAILLCMLLCALTAATFVQALLSGMQVPTADALRARAEGAMLASPFVPLVLLALSLLLICLIVIHNRHRLRRAALALGVCTIACAALMVACAFLCQPALAFLPEYWQSALIGALPSFRRFACLAACVLAALAAVLFSAFATVRRVERTVS